MRLIKLAFLSFIIFFAIITAMSLLIPSQVRISRAINLGTTDSVLFLLTKPDQWSRWHPAFQVKDAAALLQQHKISITPLFKTDSVITMQWQQAHKTPVLNSWQIHHVASSDSVTLQWYMDFRLRWYPWQKFSSLFYENTYGTMMEQGLHNIKNIVQAERQKQHMGF